MNLRSSFLLLLLSIVAVPVQAVTLFAISGDGFGVPRRLNQIDTDAQTVAPLFDLGDGSLGFYGLAYGNNRFYTVANDSFGASTLHSFTLGDAGATTSEFALGSGFVGGLAYGGGDLLYGLANDLGGASSLYSIDVGTSSVALVDGALGFGLAGGLTRDPNSGLLYALGADPGFVYSLFSIDPSTPGSSTPATFPLGFGVNGGVDYVAASDELFAIGNPLGFQGPFSELQSLQLGGGPSSLFSLSPFPSYTFSALTSGPDAIVPPTVPEPATLLLGLGLAVPLLSRRRRAG